LTAPLDRALEDLGLFYGLTPDEVERSDIDGSGCVWLETRKRGVPRWFRQGARLDELHPLDDEGLPLCLSLRGRREELEVLSWQPGRRITLARQGERGRELLKGVRGREWSRLTSAHERVERALGRPGDFQVPQLLGGSSGMAAIRTQCPDLQPLQVRRTNASLFEEVGRALRSFQERVPVEGLRPRCPKETLQELDRMAEVVLWTTERLPAGWRDRRLALSRHEWRGDELVAVHGNLHDGQLSTDGERVGLGDFDRLTAGSPLIDLANLTSHMVLRGLQEEGDCDPATVEECGVALLKGYGLDDDPAVLQEMRAHQTAAILRLALVHTVRPRWWALPNDLTRHADRFIDELQLP